MRDFTDTDIERLLAGDPGEDPDLLAFSALIEGLRAEGRRPIDPDLAARHLAAAVEAVRLAPDPVLVPASRNTARLARLRRRLAFGTLTSGLLGKLLLGSVALAAATGGAAATGSLPDPAQAALAEVASRVGISLPAPAVERVGDRPVGPTRPEGPSESELDQATATDEAEHGLGVADQAQTVDDCEAALDLAHRAGTKGAAGESGREARCGPAEEGSSNASEEAGEAPRSDSSRWGDTPAERFRRDPGPGAPAATPGPPTDSGSSPPAGRP